MPTYEYKCDECGATLEKFQSIIAPALKKCPECGKNKLRRLISAGAGVIFKGSGFYETDYRSDAYKTAAKGDNGGGVATETAKTTGTETKPAAAATKTETKTEAKPAKTEKATSKSEASASSSRKS